MIAVIADDLTGAAEIGGLALRYGLKAEVVAEVIGNTEADVLVVSADTRSVGEERAVTKISRITKELLALQPQLIYKKIDSVLRGHVVAELKAQMEMMQQHRALIVPANPDLGRTVTNGTYYFKGEPIHLSSFANDPEFPVSSSSVAVMLRSPAAVVISKNENLPASGIAVGEVVTNSDLSTWASRVDEDIVLAGAAGFFSAMLERLNFQKQEINERHDFELSQPILYVSGTTFEKSRTAIMKVKDMGGPVSYMPEEIIKGATMDYASWADAIVELLQSDKKAVIAIEESRSEIAVTAKQLREKTALIVKEVLGKTAVKELIVEGGSTAASIIKEQNFKKLIPVQELSPGVIRMKVAGEDLHLTIKPGSYEWGKNVWIF